MSKFPPGFESNDKTIAIDFDGVIHNDNKGFFDGTCYGEPIPGAKEALKDLASKYKVVIFTAKAKPDRPIINGLTGRELVAFWLEEHDMLDYVSEITSEKPRAFLYIDDNGYRFENWQDTIHFINDKGF